MSKETFSKNICEIMEQKIEAIEKYDLKKITEQNEFFEVALCIAYLALSKEKIIKKDIKNNDRIGRLTQKVDTKAIDKVFAPGFTKEMPIISSSRENNNIWILDNIRDSIMHGAFDIDEENKIIKIKNNQYNRELEAEIPFSWFIEYAKNDILSQKLACKYTVRGFYYNKNKKESKYLETKSELWSNILYRVNISGNNFNVKAIENRVKELFNNYSQEEITETLIVDHKNQIPEKLNKYNQRYLISFFIASKKVKDTIEKEFPGTNLDIYVDNRKHKFINKTKKKLAPYYSDYNIMIYMFNESLVPKGTSLLRYITNIIENNNKLNSDIENKNDLKEYTIKLHKLLTGEDIECYYKDLYTVLDKDLKTLSSIYLSVYGLSTLVINQESLYNNLFLDEKPSHFGLRVSIKQKYLDYANKRKTLIMEILDLKISLYRKQDQLNKCPNNIAKQKIQEDINKLTLTLEQYKNDLNKLEDTIKFDRVINHHEYDKENTDTIYNLLNHYSNHFESAKKVESKKQIRKIISTLLDTQKEIESKYMYGYCDNMEEALTVIRNCFSHVGRISLGKNHGDLTTIILNDYDTNGEKTGEVICKYGDLINLLSAPYQKEEMFKHK